jgi:cysteine-rich repeat protein
MKRGKNSVLFLLVFVSVFAVIGFASATVCGNTLLENGEQCDDGNLLNGDGCTSLCIVEFCGDIICNNYENFLTCPCDCGNCPVIEFCGDGIVQSGEECDDENNNNGDGCSATCQIEQEKPPICGDHLINQANETCDDGNLNNNDGCSATCKIEKCGDEQCNNGETCSTCPGDCGECKCECCEGCFCERGLCEELNLNCGDGIVQSGEQCDDGNLKNGDGCSRLCYLEKDEEKSEKANHFVEFCDSNWKCSSWSECVNGVMTRKCTDTNSCTSEYNRPYETTACVDKVLSSAYIEGKNINYFWIIAELIIFFILLGIIINLWI